MNAPTFLYDDAYITLASAQALWVGHDPHFPGTPPLYGVTSSFHCLVVAALLLVFPPAWALLISCGLGAAVYTAGLWNLARQEGLQPAEAGALAVAGLGAGMVSQHLVNGLETSWALAVVVWMITLFRRGQSTRLAALAGTAPFVRPELALIGLALLACQGLRTPDRSRSLVAVAAAAAMPWLILLWLQTGSFVPSTLAAKRDWYAEGCWPATRRLTVVGEGLVGWLSSMPVFAVSFLGLFRRRTGRVLLCAAAAIVFIWAWSVPNVLHTYQRHRYFVPFLPLLVFGLSQLPRWARPTVVWLAAVGALVASASVWRFEPVAIAQAMDVRARTVQALREQQASRVLLHDAGYLSYSDGIAEGIDMVGLKTPLAAALHARFTNPSCGSDRGRAVLELVATTRPTHLVIWEPWDEFFAITGALSDGGWSVTRRAVIDAKEPIVVYSLIPPDDLRPRTGK